MNKQQVGLRNIDVLSFLHCETLVLQGWIEMLVGEMTCSMQRQETSGRKWIPRPWNRMRSIWTGPVSIKIKQALGRESPVE